MTTNQTCCAPDLAPDPPADRVRLHAVLCDLVPGGHPKEISAAQAARILEQASPSGAIGRARAELAGEFLQDVRRLDTQLRNTRNKLAAAVRACYDMKIAEGKTHKAALRSLKRRISDAIYACLLADARRAGQIPPARTGPGRQPGNDPDSSAAGSHPERRLFGQATPGPGHHDTARHHGSHTLTAEADFKENPDHHLTAATKRTRYGRPLG